VYACAFPARRNPEAPQRAYGRLCGPLWAPPWAARVRRRGARCDNPRWQPRRVLRTANRRTPLKANPDPRAPPTAQQRTVMYNCTNGKKELLGAAAADTLDKPSPGPGPAPGSGCATLKTKRDCKHSDDKCVWCTAMFGQETCYSEVRSRGWWAPAPLAVTAGCSPLFVSLRCHARGYSRCPLGADDTLLHHNLHATLPLPTPNARPPPTPSHTHTGPVQVPALCLLQVHQALQRQRSGGGGRDAGEG